MSTAGTFQPATALATERALWYQIIELIEKQESTIGREIVQARAQITETEKGNKYPKSMKQPTLVTMIEDRSKQTW